MARREVRNIAYVALGVTASLLLSACNSTPDTYFDWGVKGQPRHVASRSPDVRPMERPGGRKRFVFREASNDDPRPISRPTPGWYADSHPDNGDNCLPAKHANAAPKPVAPEKSVAVQSLRFSWPVRGRVISDFGAHAGGERNDGINIAAAPETPIRASASGTVGYVGNEIGGFGNLVLIRHDGDYVTTYAHAKRFTVQKGDTVKAGDIIGYTGESGDVTRPQLHFEIRRGVTPLNPMRLLASNS